MALTMIILIAVLACLAIAFKIAVGFMALAVKAGIVLVLALGAAAVAKKVFFSN